MTNPNPDWPQPDYPYPGMPPNPEPAPVPGPSIFDGRILVTGTGWFSQQSGVLRHDPLPRPPLPKPEGPRPHPTSLYQPTAPGHPGPMPSPVPPPAPRTLIPA